MSLRQICSRREADELIKKGWVRVNGQIAELGQKAKDSAKIELLPEAKRWLGKKYSVLLYKPIGFVSGQAEDGHRPAITLLTPDKFQGTGPSPWKHPRSIRGLAPAGRLDIDSKGLLILTQDGRLAKKIIQANSSISKEYIVKVHSSIGEDQIKKLQQGLKLDGKALKKAKVQQLNPSLLNITLWEGKKRQIRRMCEAVGLKVLLLKRIRVGNLKLGSLKEGEWRLISKEEEKKLLTF